MDLGIAHSFSSLLLVYSIQKQATGEFNLAVDLIVGNGS
jgi:hypothetical protein